MAALLVAITIFEWLTGRKTEVVYRRYAIVAESGLFEAVRKRDSGTNSEFRPRLGTELDQRDPAANAGNAENSL